MATPQQIIDGYLGPDAYDEWQDLAQRTRTELARSARLKSIPAFIPVSSTIVSEPRELEVIAEDYDEGMKLILGGSKVDPQAVGNIAALYNTALDLVEFENNLAEAILATGVAKAFVLITFGLLAAQAARFEAKLKALEQSLQRAKTMVVIGLEKENTIGTEMENVRAEAEGFTCPSWAFPSSLSSTPGSGNFRRSSRRCGSGASAGPAAPSSAPPGRPAPTPRTTGCS